MSMGNTDERSRFCAQSHGRERQVNQQLQHSTLDTGLEVCVSAVGVQGEIPDSGWVEGGIIKVSS